MESGLLCCFVKSAYKRIFPALKFSCLFIGAMTLVYAAFHEISYLAAEKFAISNISSALEKRSEWEFSLSPQEEASIKTLLTQEFTYLGKGVQCFAFESSDGKYVLKFFRYERLRAPTWLAYLPLPSPLRERYQKKLASKKEKEEKLFRSCVLAYKELKEESGLLFLHLTPAENFHQMVTLKDKLGRSYTLPIDQFAYFLQRKAKPLYTALGEWIAAGKWEEAKEALSHLLALLEKRYQKGIVDGDAVIRKNTGFLGSQPIYIDVGQFVKDESIKERENFQKTTEVITSRLEEWLQKECPPLATYLKEEREKL